MSTGVLDQIPRSSLVLLLLAQAAVIVPHVPRLSPWILGVWAVCVLWRVFIFTGRWGYPNRWVRAVLVVLAAIGVVAGYGEIYGLEPAVALLIVAFALKLLEMRDRRDALVVIYLGYFNVATELLFEQGMAVTGYGLACMVLVTAALVGLNQSWKNPQPLATVRKAAQLMAQALPLTVVMFVFFPRVAPLWSVPMPSAASETGLSDSMTPGQIAELGRSEELVFRVDFEGEPPARRALYWRALTFSSFEDGTWSSSEARRPPVRLVWWTRASRVPSWLAELDRSGPAVRYSVMAEPTYRPWLYALDAAEPQTPGTGVGRDFRVLNRTPVATRMSYDVVSHPEALLDAELPIWMRDRSLKLPPQGNPRARALAQRIMADTDDPREKTRQILTRFYQQEYFYTLTPPTLQGDTVDGFLFDTRQGFCAHYAGAFVYLMRLMDVPARVVAGYQGGEFNPLGNHLVVRQYDAHAWAEIWIDGEGWVRVDPTAAVAPGRIEQGAQAAFADESQTAGDTPFKGLRWSQLMFVSDLLYYIESLEYRWNVLVVGYDASVQSRFLQRLLGEATPLRIAMGVALAALIAIIIGSSGLLLSAYRFRRDPVRRLFDRFCATFADAGVPRAPRESPRAYAGRLQARFPAQADDIEALASWFDGVLYAGDDITAPPPALRRTLLRLRLQLTLQRLRGAAPAASR